MTSLNGDAFVMRNGRSTSQVSIYNYPEHLNPFYEDEQHKRLRFWQINKSNGSGSRRNSFSLSGLKDVWAFKSFRLKKKSSTLGINKTSESPPPLRRDLYSAEMGNDLSLPDYKTRYSTPAGSNDNFQRNAGYRTSLQNVAFGKDKSGSQMDFNRNNQYRSTIQVMGTKSNNNHNYNNNNNSLRTAPVPQPRRYVYGGSVTPQPLRNSDIGAGVGLSHGSSQISMASTNPFDTDDDDDGENNEDVSLAGDRLMITSTPIKQRMQRKKRRAPAPPTVGDGSIHPQPLPELRIEECMDIANLTAAIEDFVKTTNDDESASIPAAKTNKQITEEVASTSATSKQNGTANPVPDGEPQSTSQQVADEKDDAVIEKNQQAEKSESPERKVVLETNNVEAKISNQPNTVSEPEVGQMECIHIHMGSQQTPIAAERTEHNRLSSFRGEQTRSPEPQQSITTKTSFTLTTPPTARRDSTKKTKVSLKTTEVLKFPVTEELRITENVTTPKATKSPTATKPTVSPKPHVAEIHKPARGITSTRTDETQAVEIENRQPPMSPVPPVRRGPNLKQPEANVVKPTEEEYSSIVKQAPVSAVKPTEGESEPTKLEQPETDNQIATNRTAPTTSTLSLTIRESHEDLLERDDTTNHFISNDTKITNVSTTPHRTQSPTELREEALESLYRPKPNTSYLQWKQSALAPLERSVPPEKRKSVKDIIESINRSQRLLNASAHKDAPQSDSSHTIAAPVSVNGTPLPRRKFSGQSAIEKQAQDMQYKGLNGNTNTITTQNEDLPTTSTAASLALDDSAATNMNGDVNEQDPLKLNNNEIFKKCTVKKEVQYDYREQSPTTSNLDWNPVPKPKRNKNLSEQ